MLQRARMSFVIGVAGGTGSGKTTVARAIGEALPDGAVVTIAHDAYYRDRSKDLSFEARCELNFDHPQSLETELLVEHVRALREGKAIEVPIYDYALHARKTETRRVEPAPVIVVEGILIFAHENLRSLFDIKVFVDTDADVRLLRRIERDIEERGRTFQSVRAQYDATVRPMHLAFVEPSKRYADLIVPEGGENRVAIDLLVARARGLLVR